MLRTTVLLSLSQVKGLAEIVKTDPAGLKSSHLIRQFIADGIARRKRQAAEAAK
ncbi:MAG: hypothetical protein WCB00_24245 [Candidatus Acidiferrales bacterium]